MTLILCWVSLRCTQPTDIVVNFPDMIEPYILVEDRYSKGDRIMGDACSTRRSKGSSRAAIALMCSYADNNTFAIKQLCSSHEFVQAQAACPVVAES